MPRTESNPIELGAKAPDFVLPDADGRLHRLGGCRAGARPARRLHLQPMPLRAPDPRGAGTARAGLRRPRAGDRRDQRERRGGASRGDARADRRRRSASKATASPTSRTRTSRSPRPIGAACTPDLFLYDADRRLAYHGQFDDARPGNGKPVTGADLRDAVDAVLAGERPSDAQVPSIGCNIKWLEGNEPAEGRRRGLRPPAGRAASRPSIFIERDEGLPTWRHCAGKACPPGRTAETDVLVIGGGPAAAWAAIAAAEAGAGVTLVDKGYHGTSGATAPSNTGTWCVPPGEHRAQAVARRWERTIGLADQRWMLRLVDRCYENLQRLVEWGYPFPTEESGLLYTANLRGPDYMRFMRARVLRAGVRVLDHHPATELLSDGATVTGAAGLVRARPARTGGSRPAPPCSRPAAAPSSSASSAAPGLTGDGLLDGGRGRRLAVGDGVHRQVHARARTTPRSTRACRSAGRPSTTPTARRSATPRASRWRTASARPRRTWRGRCIAGPVYARLDLAERGAAGLAAPGPAELLPALRPARHRSVPRPLPRHAPRRGHGARHRRHPRHQLGMHDRGAGPLRRRRRRDPRERRGRDLGRRLGQLGLGDVERLVGRPGRRRLRPPPRRARPPSAPSRAGSAPPGCARPSARAPSTRARWWRRSATR